MGNSSVHRSAQGPLRVQRKSFHLHGHLQRILTVCVPQRFHVSDLLLLLFVYCLYTGRLKNTYIHAL